MLTGKQKRFLRSRAQTIKAIFQLGKNGLSDAFAQQVVDALERRELLKISLLQNSDVDLDEAAEFLQKFDPTIEVAQKIGRVLVLYRPAHKKENRRLSPQVKALVA
ncbi:YhbY family RNA-binding protein [Lactobacillus selangorensis]|uniref:YhbY family RNA-binding protein n=1 Tax=Lactobacillus selangorensis TaxID=81857 RepID=UPI00070EE24B|nr:YhbY family RNA-binding protein [Lactobacillus selangorensis]